ncbi:MAG TPA: NAD(P)-binding domain-containing protein [Thermoleophilaceae bacterium]|nr:NAD(P)-binding domain-containing protein [Thermoleophilaceae bacterium]
MDVLVIGAGPYGLATAAAARAAGLDTVVVGRPMGFWREHMPPGMNLRSGPDWHLDAHYEHTLERFLGDDVPDPLPLRRFLDYAEWFQERTGLQIRDERVTALEPGFVATLESGERLHAPAVVAAPGIAHFAHRPAWAERVPGEHTCDLIDLRALEGQDVAIIGGRQSAYEWAALASEHGAARVDVVHRHATPRFERSDWSFVDPLVERTRTQKGWWRALPEHQRQAITRRFWEVGRLALEDWLGPRVAGVHTHARTEVVGTAPGRLELSDGTTLTPDRVVYATGYVAALERVPYLPAVTTRDGFPVLDDAMGTSLDGLYLPGFAATQDFGPFFGFVKGAPAAAELIVRDLATR